MYLITAALPYSNGPLHLGHIRSTYLPADIYKRFLIANGEKALYICASDEHGTPISIAAEKQGKKPEEIASFYHEQQKKDFQNLGFDMDIFYETHSKENEELTILFFEKLKENGYIYKTKVLQYFCKELGVFMPDRYIKGQCPYCGAENQYADQCEKCGRTFKPGELKNPYCVLTDTKPILKESEHYFFKLSAFKEFLEQYIKKGKFQDEVKKYALSWLNELRDWDITRDMKWGIKVPNSNLVFYVWFDAPIGYISSTKALTKDWKQWWKNDNAKVIHFIGKDIIYHHYLFWPSMLYGTKLNFNLPYAMPVRGHLLLENKKFSKSRGHYITVKEFLSVFPADYLRYYMTYITPYTLNDANFSLEEFKERINNDLIANYGNFIYRVSKLLEKNGIKKINIEDSFKNEIKNIIKKYNSHMENFYFKLGLEDAMSLVKEGNRYLNKEQPWKLEDKKRVTILNKAGEYAIFSTLLLYPFIPLSTEPLLNEWIGNKHYKKALQSIKTIHFAYLKQPLFKKVEDNEINKLKEMLKKRAMAATNQPQNN